MNEDAKLFHNEINHNNDCERGVKILNLPMIKNLIQHSTTIKPKLILKQINSNLVEELKFEETVDNLKKISQTKYQIKQKIYPNFQNTDNL